MTLKACSFPEEHTSKKVLLKIQLFERMKKYGKIKIAVREKTIKKKFFTLSSYAPWLYDLVLYITKTVFLNLFFCSDSFEITWKALSAVDKE